MSAIGDVITIVLDAQRTLDGRIFNQTTGLWEPATPATIAAGQKALNDSISAVMDTLTFPISLGTLGAIDRTEAEAMVVKVTAALKAYVTATTK